MGKAEQCGHCHSVVPPGYKMFPTEPGKSGLCATCEGRLHGGGRVICARCGTSEARCFADDPTDPSPPATRRKLCWECTKQYSGSSQLYGRVQASRSSTARQIQAGFLIFEIPSGNSHPRAGQHVRFRPDPRNLQQATDVTIVRY